MDKTFKLWARVGMTFTVTPENQEDFLESFQSMGGQDWQGFIQEGLARGTVEVDGETYFPDVDDPEDCPKGNVAFERYVNDPRFWTEG